MAPNVSLISCKRLTKTVQNLHGSYYSAGFIFPDFSLTFEDKINHFR